MSRITAPVSKLTRTIGSHASIARSSNPLSNAPKSGVSVSRLPDIGDHHHVESHDSNARHISTLPSHRPQPVPSRHRTVPLMQTFTTSSRPSARADTSTIDYALMPTHSALYASSDPSVTDPHASLRVPLLPDSFNVAHAPETLDAPLPAPEISVVAAVPENVAAVSPLTEVEGMGADGVELGFVHGLETGAKGKQQQQEEGGGMIRDLWKGLMDDVFGEEPKPKAA